MFTPLISIFAHSKLSDSLAQRTICVLVLGVYAQVLSKDYIYL